MDAANEAHLPTDLLRVLGARKGIEAETALWAAALLLGNVMYNLHGGQVSSVLAAIPLGSRLFAAFPLFLLRRVSGVGGAPECRGLRLRCGTGLALF